MARKKIESENDEIEAIDLISLLSTEDNIDSYNTELAVPEQDIDFLALGAEQLKEDAEKLAKAKTIIPSQEPKTSLSKKITTTTITTTTTTTSSSSAAARPSSLSSSPITPTRITTVIPTKSINQTQIVSKPQAPTKKTINILKPIEGFENDSIEQIIKDIGGCERCGLCKTRNHVVPGVGNTKAKLVLIGEAPGADEDSQGIPFVGKAGKHLDKILAAAGFKKEELYICNILKCRPPNNRDPNIDEMRVCTPFLQRQLALIKPKIIGCLGNVACHYVIGPTMPGITRLRGQWFDSIFGIPTFAMYHPSYLIRSESREKGSPNWQMWQDIRALKAKYDEI